MPTDSASKFYKYIVNDKFDHINDVVVGVLCLAISMILNKITIQSMNHNIWVSSLARLGPKGICDKVFESRLSLGGGIVV